MFNVWLSGWNCCIGKQLNVETSSDYVLLYFSEEGTDTPPAFNKKVQRNPSASNQRVKLGKTNKLQPLPDHRGQTPNVDHEVCEAWSLLMCYTIQLRYNGAH